ncbi:hypothetical protein O0L34_g12227 [Tuta absoluta]|nr:hypothetical protein O0L34_g12227 [Tuta absoluta]
MAPPGSKVPGGVCATCKKKIPKRDYIKCKQCLMTFDLDCANVSTKLFDLMKNKSNWKCKHCLSEKSSSGSKLQKKTKPSVPCASTPKTMSISSTHEISSTELQDENNDETILPNTTKEIIQNQNIEELSQNITVDKITLRKKRTTEILHTSLPNVTASSSALSDDDSSNQHRSLPDLSTLHNNEIEELRQEIASLKMKALAADNHIEELTLENISMQKKIGK